MSDFFAPQADWWRKARNRIPRPFGREEALIDLRWWQDQVLIGREVRIPTSENLGAEWGWGEKKARLLLQREAEWSDPAKAEAWKKHKGRTEGGRRADGGRPEGGAAKGSTDTVVQKGRTEGGRRADGGREKGDTRGDSPTPTPTPTENNTASPPAPLVLLPPLADPEPSTVVDPTPKWARAHKGTPAIEVLGHVVRALEAIRQRPIDFERCASDAKHVLSLWKSVGGPLGGLVDQIEVVARWARESPDPLAENDVRGMRRDGTLWGTDRSLSVSTLCVHARWGDRLDAALRWESGVDPPAFTRGDHPQTGTELRTTEQAEAYFQSLGMDPNNPVF